MKETSRMHYGFTLIEILIVIGIIGVLVSVIMPSVNQARAKALVAATIVEINGIKTAFQLLHDATGYYPNGDTSFCRTILPGSNEINLSTANAGLTANGLGWIGWSGPYISSATDKWGSPYYLDEDYDCMTATEGCKGVNDGGSNASSVIVSCGPNKAISNGSCAYDTDNIVYRLCD